MLASRYTVSGNTAMLCCLGDLGNSHDFFLNHLGSEVGEGHATSRSLSFTDVPDGARVQSTVVIQ